MRSTPLLAASAFALLLVGCASPDGIAPNSKAIDPSALSLEKSIRDTANGQPWPTEDWWSGFHDDQLNGLMSQALRDSPALKLAEARIRKAQAVAGLSKARLSPEIDAAASVTDERFTGKGLYPSPYANATRTNNNAGLTGSYHLDLWGGDEAAYRQALGSVKAAEVDAQAARLELTAAIANAYVALAAEWDQLDIDRDLLRQKNDIQQLTSKLSGAGLGSDIEKHQAEAAIAATAAEIAGSEERIALLKQSLAVLAGASPDQGDGLARPALHMSASIGLPSTLPADLIGRRPDVVAQRWRVEASGHAITAAKAQFYPNINLSAFIGLQSIGLDNFLTGASRTYGAGPAITLPIFEGGRLRSALAQSAADQDIEVEQYNAAVLSALRDIANQLTSWKANQTVLNNQQVAVNRLEEAYRLALLRYREGLSNYLTVLSAEGELTDQKRKEAVSKNRQYALTIALTHALGGGITPQAPAANP